jgi:hypothetical protein
MDESPYRSPQSDLIETELPESIQKARRIAQYQRWVLYALLANILLYIFALPNTGGRLFVGLIIAALFVLIGIFAVFAVFKLAQELSGTAVAVICAILMFMPCISLITLLIVNQKATGFLQSQGIKVGFMGTDPNNIK